MTQSPGSTASSNEIAGIGHRPAGTGRILIAQALNDFATALSILFPAWVSIALIVLIQLNYVIAPRIPILNRF